MFRPTSCLGQEQDMIQQSSGWGHYEQHGCDAYSPGYMNNICSGNVGSHHSHGLRGEMRPCSLPVSSSRKPRRSRKHSRKPRNGYARDGAFELDYPNCSPVLAGTGPFFHNQCSAGYAYEPQHVMGLGRPMYNYPLSIGAQMQFLSGPVTQVPNLPHPPCYSTPSTLLSTTYASCGTQAPPVYARDGNHFRATALQADEGQPQPQHQPFEDSRTSSDGRGHMDSHIFKNIPLKHGRSTKNQSTNDVDKDRPDLRNTNGEGHNHFKDGHPVNQMIPSLDIQGPGGPSKYYGQCRGVVNQAPASVRGPSESATEVRDIGRDGRFHNYVHPYAETELLSDDGMVDEEELLQRFGKVRLADKSDRRRKRHH